jgi:hypothetical protein
MAISHHLGADAEENTMRMWQLNDCLFVKQAAAGGPRESFMLSRPGGNASSKRKADAIRRLSIAGGPPFIGK